MAQPDGDDAQLFASYAGLGNRPKRQRKAVARFDQLTFDKAGSCEGFACPSCHAECAYDSKECHACGLAVSRLKERTEVGGARSSKRRKREKKQKAGEKLEKQTGIPAALNDEGEGKPRRVVKTFEERLEELKAYKTKHAHLRVKMSEDKSLAKYCEAIRAARRGTSKTKLTAERIASLNDLGFEWDPQSEKDKSFQKRLDELRAYKAKHGHLKAKQSEHKSLYRFCVHIRRAHRGHGTMKLTEDRIASLDALGFDWNPPQEVKSFQERVEELMAYKAKHGHLKVKKSEDSSLAQFCKHIRYVRKHSSRKLSEERIASLDAIGFDWKMLGDDEESFSELDGELLPDWIDDYEDEGNWDEGGILQREES